MEIAARSLTETPMALDRLPEPLRSSSENVVTSMAAGDRPSPEDRHLCIMSRSLSIGDTPLVNQRHAIHSSGKQQAAGMIRVRLRP